MVRGYLRKSETVLGEDIVRAIRYYKSDIKPTQRETCAVFGLTRSLFQKYLKFDISEIPEVCSQGRNGVFSEAMEEEIMSYIYMLANRFYAITLQFLAELAYQLVRNNLPHPFKDGRAGDGWVSSFLERNDDELSTRTGTPLSLIRITSFKKQNVYRFFDLIEEIVAAKHCTAESIFDMDVTGVTIVPCQRDFCSSFFEFPNNAIDVSMQQAPANSTRFRISKGWTTSEAFLKWLKHFRKYSAPTPDVPVLLILDNHSFHVSYNAVSYRRRNNFDLLTLPRTLPISSSPWM
ncbi:unnamed protein product [Allacma fusca]|uniref:HTH CENPB-type domain-containing protein n=1 Tax=Allacma fusca TaxID=39272 RepID=A0A8J2LUI5_9HEXA|nr:unnamed protein product [Allacma fusca]